MVESDEIEVVNDGPIYICKSCRVMLKVPEEKLEKNELIEETDDGTEIHILCTFYICPKCYEMQIVCNEEIDETKQENESDD